MVNLLPSVKLLLQQKIDQYNHIDFIDNDPISIPHQFSSPQDIEISAFLTATFSWGNRKYIIDSAKKCMLLMNNEPYDFIMNPNNATSWHQTFKYFTHRTFGLQDTLTFLSFLQYHYYHLKEASLETAFTNYLHPTDHTIENTLNGFNNYFFSTTIHGNDAILRKKHLGAPFKKSACKRINMFLRWMVRNDKHGVDFGLWKHIKPSQLIIPLDVHVLNVAIKLELLAPNAKANWENAVLLTNILKQLDANDPVKYDYALFSLGVVEKVK